MLRIPPALAALLVSLSIALPAIAQDAPHHREARQIFERLIAFRSAAGHGQVVPMARYIADTLRAGGVPAADITEIPLDDVVALLVRLPGSDASARPLLFSAHMDVVDARP
jgi:carboxypeptidase PM20D1